MKARDIMTSPVVTVGPETSVHEIAAIMFKRHVSAVPVVADGRLAGIVSEADLEAHGKSRAGKSWWLPGAP